MIFLPNLKQLPNRFHRQEEAGGLIGEGEKVEMAKNIKRNPYLLDRCHFSLAPRDFNRFLKKLERSPKDLARIRKTLTTPPPWKER